jgi:hypothetical protein
MEAVPNPTEATPTTFAKAIQQHEIEGQAKDGVSKL